MKKKPQADTKAQTRKNMLQRNDALLVRLLRARPVRKAKRIYK